MSTHDNGPPPPDWSPEPRPSPFDAVFESAQHKAWVRGTDTCLADRELDGHGTE